MCLILNEFSEFSEFSVCVCVCFSSSSRWKPRGGLFPRAARVEERVFLTRFSKPAWRNSGFWVCKECVCTRGQGQGQFNTTSEEQRFSKRRKVGNQKFFLVFFLRPPCCPNFGVWICNFTFPGGKINVILQRHLVAAQRIEYIQHMSPGQSLSVAPFACLLI